MTVICLVLSLFGIDDISDIIALIINLVLMGFIAFYAWKYSQNAKQMQTNANIEQLAQGTSSLNMILIINGVLFIIGLVILGTAFLFGMLAAAIGR